MAADVLEIYLADIRRLFNSMDPAPFHERDLDPNAADYIREWAEELPDKGPLALGVLKSLKSALDPENLIATGISAMTSAAKKAEKRLPPF